jgi:hypothetical protein
MELELTDAKNKIKDLETKIADLTQQLLEKQYEMVSIKENMETQFVDGWTVKDSYGGKGEFHGNIYWIKGEGILYYKDRTSFEGDWDSSGEINNGELSNCNGDVITKWEDGVELGEEEEEEDEEEEDEEEEDEEDEEEEDEDEEDEEEEV